MAEPDITWLVLRSDDSSNVYLVQDKLDADGAFALVQALTDRGHKQTYTAYAYVGRSEREQLFARFNVIG
jgi:hypothetical protein